MSSHGLWALGQHTTDKGQATIAACPPRALHVRNIPSSKYFLLWVSSRYKRHNG